MIALDTSAIIAVLQDEPEAQDFLECMALANERVLSAVSFQEAAMILTGRRQQSDVWGPLDKLVQRYSIDIVPHDLELARIARDAFLRYGKDRHPARLNCGDCASYALAKHRRIPLLFKGGDFGRTDIIAAIPAE